MQPFIIFFSSGNMFARIAGTDLTYSFVGSGLAEQVVNVRILGWGMKNNVLDGISDLFVETSGVAEDVLVNTLFGGTGELIFGEVSLYTAEGALIDFIEEAGAALLAVL